VTDESITKARCTHLQRTTVLVPNDVPRILPEEGLRRPNISGLYLNQHPFKIRLARLQGDNAVRMGTA
jgi:hypothetical protein